MSNFCHFFDISWNWPKTDPFVERIPRNCALQKRIYQFRVSGQKVTRIRPAPQQPRLKTSKRCRFFWTPKRVVFWNNLALKCPIFVTFLTSRLTKSARFQNYYRFDSLMSKSLSFWRSLVIYFLWEFFGYFWYTHFWPPSILDKIVRISKLLSFWQPHVKITIVLRTSGH